MMAEELKHLIDQIQKEGVEKAEEQAAAILSQAKEKAAKLVTEADQKAADLLAKSETEAEAFAKRSVRTLEQAARDLLITVGQGCEKVVTETLGQQIDKTIDGGLLEKMILSVIEQHQGESAEFSVSEADQKALTAFCAAQAKKSGQKIELTSDAEVLSGFKVGFKGSNAYLDFTGEAVAEALSAFLRPELAKIVSNVAREQLAKD
jgi:V/A-type H+-transporting ATPase subunit E